MIKTTSTPIKTQKDHLKCISVGLVVTSWLSVPRKEKEMRKSPAS